jgi:two-component system, OmpR family, sensor kinase
VLTRRAVEDNVLRDLSNQADVLAGRERKALTPLGKLDELRQALAPERVRPLAVPLTGTSPYLPGDAVAEIRLGRPVNGRVTVEGERYLFAARLVSNRGFVLVRPTSSVASNWWPHFEGLAIGAAVAAALAAIAAFLLARAISRPVRRVAEAARRLPDAESPSPVPVEGARELALLAESFNEMAGALAKARAAERQFLLSVSHELKTPLTAIRGYAEGLADGAFPVDEAAETISREAQRLERLLRDLLDLARMNKAEFSIRREPVDLGAAARETVRRYEGQAAGFGVALDAVVTEPAPAMGDTDRILQIVSNLVENALRLTPAGGSVRVVAEPGLIAVEDTGPGLGPDELPHAFERFFLYSRYGAERPVGTGLGLAIVKELAEGMGGRVEATSEPGTLTRFAVRLEPAPAPERELAPA